MDVPSSLTREISPPRPLKRRKTSGFPSPSATPIPAPSTEPALAAVEAGKARIDDHITYFSSRLSKASRPSFSGTPRLSIQDFSTLYSSNQHQLGSHFVVHQHNHPRAGVHYDLRLQFSETSSISFALPKGLPGNPNSRSIGRMAIETRVHNYWNHLIESASHKTGSLLIWDTGTYEVLPRKKKPGSKKGIPSPQTSDDEAEDSDIDQKISRSTTKAVSDTKHENEKLITAFQTRYIRLRLHGTRLTQNYTVILRLPSNEIIARPTSRKKSTRKSRPKPIHPQSDSDTDTQAQRQQELPKDSHVDVQATQERKAEEDIDTDTDEDIHTRMTNAYPGSTNSIGSIHQRHWFLQLDRQNSGFIRAKSGNWERGFEPFLVRGRDFERSIITGRLARDVEEDEGLEGYVGRGGWVGIYH
jgi:hypothetical protein